VSLSLRTLNGEYNGLGEKIAFIRGCYHKSLTDLRLRRFAEQTAGKGSRYQQAGNLFQAIRQVMVYTPDPVGVEYTKSPSKMMDDIEARGKAYGDCDDFACLSRTLLMLIGIPAKLRVIWKGTGAMPRHIFTVASIDGQDVAFDTAARTMPMGEETSYTRKVDFQ